MTDRIGHARFTSLALGLGTLLLCFAAQALASNPPRCLIVSSYHSGYAWSDGELAALRAGLASHCRIRVSELDSKRRPAPAQLTAAAREIDSLIRSWRPDVVITLDDNAMRYVALPYLRGTNIPVVFAGINASVAPYGLPWPNATGMIERAPFHPLLEAAQTIVRHGDVLAYLAADTVTERRDLTALTQTAAPLGIRVVPMLVETGTQWIEALRQAQHAANFILLGSPAGIRDWDPTRARVAVRHDNHRLTLTTYTWMMPYAMLGFTRSAEEEGHWAAAVAEAILKGSRPSSIPIIPSQDWDEWQNTALLKAADIRLPSWIASVAKRADPQ
ncbi:hypothetical protein BI364_00530 [Acidihalobacter yilgarnensis]|uniref:ABC transporter substrate-binding protein n=1 Tax=Acidihalobacter yilgarnensis TaxID=2819280 RepID=A0A1D8IJV3_9GAMM|nr:hypothetical protein [Acidihalobacter yilgarnensis]AOU96704.1 hypothetical protein BI364_00530 [Acidihalobacter yilgarnensis]